MAPSSENINREGFYKLPVYIGTSLNHTIAGTIFHLANTHFFHDADNFVKGFYLCSTFLLLKTGNICKYNDAPDGCWKQVNEIPGYSIEPDISAINRDNLRIIEKLIVATKINWFNENNHVGINPTDSYVKKVHKKLLPDRNWSNDRLWIHQIGLWASTHSVLTQCGVENVSVVEALFETTDRILPSTTKLLKSPAGTERHAIAFNLFKLMIRSPAALLCPDILDAVFLADAYNDILKNPAVYHLSANYLCGRRANFDDNMAERYLGRAGTFGSIFYKNTTLMKSHHVSNFTNKPDYDYMFERNLYKLARESFKSCDAAMNMIAAHTTPTTPNVANYRTICQAFGVPTNDFFIQRFERPRPVRPADPADDWDDTQ